MCKSRIAVSILLALAHLWTLSPATSLASEPIELARGEASPYPQQPQVAVDAKGTIHVVYGVGDTVRYRRSTDGGKSFEAPVDLPEVHRLALGMRRGPRISLTDATICVTAIGGKQGKGRDGDLLALRSMDSGQTWSKPVSVNDTADSAREGLHAMAAGAKGELCCVWLDLRNQKSEVMSSVSSDGGGTWSKNVLVYRSPDGSVCECCHPSVAFDSRGQIAVMWRNSLDGARDLYVAHSSNGGREFSKPSKLGTGTWSLNACPMDGGSIASTGPGKFVSVWRRDKSVYLSHAGSSQERSLGLGEQPWVTATDAGHFVVWLTKRHEVAYLLTPGQSTPMELASTASDPVLAASPTGKGPVVAVWESRDGKTRSIQCRIIDENRPGRR